MHDAMLDELARKRDRYLRLARRPSPLRRHYRRRAQRCEELRCAALLERYKTAPAWVWTAPFDAIAARCR